ncbi:MAG: copper resistance D family protein [Actinomycetota bacterium]
MGFEEDLRFVAFTLARFTSFAAHALLFGLVPTILLVLRPAFARLPVDDWAAGRRRVAARIEGLVNAALVASAAASAVAITLQAVLISELRDEDIGGSAVTSVFETSFGQWYAFRFPLLVALALILYKRVGRVCIAGAGDDTPGPSPLYWAAWGGCGLLLLATSSFSGHAAVADPRWGALVNDIVHLAAGSAWFAGLVVLAVILPDAWRDADASGRLGLLAPSVVRFSNVAVVTISIVAITGVLNSFLHVGAIDDLVDSSYGRALALKLVLFGVVLALGAINHLGVRRRFEKAVDAGPLIDTQRLFRKAIAVELAVAVGLLGMTGLLVGQGRTAEAAAPPRVVSSPLL